MKNMLYLLKMSYKWDLIWFCQQLYLSPAERRDAFSRKQQPDYNREELWIIRADSENQKNNPCYWVTIEPESWASGIVKSAEKFLQTLGLTWEVFSKFCGFWHQRNFFWVFVSSLCWFRDNRSGYKRGIIGQFPPSRI